MKPASEVSSNCVFFPVKFPNCSLSCRSTTSAAFVGMVLKAHRSHEALIKGNFCLSTRRRGDLSPRVLSRKFTRVRGNETRDVTKAEAKPSTIFS